MSFAALWTFWRFHACFTERPPITEDDGQDDDHDEQLDEREPRPARLARSRECGEGRNPDGATSWFPAPFYARFVPGPRSDRNSLSHKGVLRGRPPDGPGVVRPHDTFRNTPQGALAACVEPGAVGYDSVTMERQALEKLRGFRSEPAFVVQLRESKWAGEDQKKDLLEKFQALAKPEVEWVAWTAVDSVPEIRAAGLAILKRRHDRAGLRPSSRSSRPVRRRPPRRHALPEGPAGLSSRRSPGGRFAGDDFRGSRRSSSRGSCPRRWPSTSPGAS